MFMGWREEGSRIRLGPFFDDSFKRVCLFWHTLLKITFRTDD